MTIVERDANGDLVVPAAYIGSAASHTTFELQVAGDTLTLRPVAEARPFWKRATPAERADAFRQWVAACPPVSQLPDEAFQRENWYD